MSQQIGGYPPSTTGGVPAGQPGLPPDARPTGQVARDEAQDVGRTAADAGRHVAGTAAEQAGNVAQEVKSQARDLVGEARGQVQDQARTGQRKAVDAVRALSQELREMADTGQSGTVSEIARQAADRADRAASWLGEREPADLVDEVRSFARRRPGAFLVGAALAGIVVGRLTRGAIDSARADSARPAVSPYARTPLPASPAYGGTGDLPTPPQGYAAASPQGYPTERSYASEPTGYTPAAPLPPAAPAYDPDPLAERAYAEPAYDADPLTEPTGRRSTGTVGEYVDDIERTGERRGTAPDERIDEPFRPGGDYR